ncbi:beta-ketoacyl-[acyl-carrier-protein] synthase family protein [Paenibacillus endoradicis]|uniref:beta-ketoacyl-[acyl-carrier-protein] synthase family protein n=1 Tax=Paenibacillus endoradicis TaxID=2972487 RepID=UPI002158E35D|nr:beta-ketoacyl-[acyl-carrier-protein] synthase family protein [Paenibacillus endoradicis]MCR8657740.1 beta-ketoacyl-[acyl-carrier-protein] synthase family protein [Paenibacillus endoradicis]
MNKKRVVVTGIGCVTPLGLDAKQTWMKMLEGQSGVSKISVFDVSNMDTQIAAQVKDFNLHPSIPPKFSRLLSRSSGFGLNAFLEAISDAGIDVGEEPNAEIGISMGCGLIYPELEQFQETFARYFNDDPEDIDVGQSFFGPIDILKRNSITGAALMAQWLRAAGPMYTINTACASSAHSIGTAFRSIQDGEASVMIAGGYDSMVNYIDLLGFGLLGALSMRNDEPELASRPFDKNRDGFVIGEGATMIVLEDLEHALARNANIYAELVGFSSTLNAYRITDSPPEGGECITVMCRAMEEAELTPSEIDYISVHGTSTPYNDYSETMAIRAALGDAADQVAISSVKSMVGHMTNASGGINFISTVLAIRDQILPPTINYETPDAKLTLDCVPNHARKSVVNAALVNAFAFGGTNVCLAVKSYEGEHIDEN